MNPLGMFVGLMIGLLLMAAGCLGPPVFILLSARRLGIHRWSWSLFATAPSIALWATLHGSLPVLKSVWPAGYPVAALLVYANFRFFTRHLAPMPVSSIARQELR